MRWIPSLAALCFGVAMPFMACAHTVFHDHPASHHADAHLDSPRLLGASPDGCLAETGAEHDAHTLKGMLPVERTLHKQPVAGLVPLRPHACDGTCVCHGNAVHAVDVLRPQDTGRATPSRAPPRSLPA